MSFPETPTGPSTGWMYAINVPPDEQGKILEEAGATCAEVCLQGWGPDVRMLSLPKVRMALPLCLRYLSVHLPTVDGVDVEERGRQLAAAHWAVHQVGASVAVTHPIKVGGDYPVKCYEEMIASGVPLAIENMDRDKDSGRKLEELVELVEALGCGFVLDLQHAFEQDPMMGYAAELLDALRDRLVHLHVSGEAERDNHYRNNHSLVCRATNAGRIVEFLGRVFAVKKDLPIVLEGEYTDADELREEIRFLKGKVNL